MKEYLYGIPAETLLVDAKQLSLTSKTSLISSGTLDSPDKKKQYHNNQKYVITVDSVTNLKLFDTEQWIKDERLTGMRLD